MEKLKIGVDVKSLFFYNKLLQFPIQYGKEEKSCASRVNGRRASEDSDDMQITPESFNSIRNDGPGPDAG